MSDHLQLITAPFGVLAIFAKLRRENVMPGQAARNPRDNEQRFARQIDKIKSLEDAGRLSDARRARETLATITETRDALRLRLKVENEVAVTEAR